MKTKFSISKRLVGDVGGGVWVACVGDHRRGWGWGARAPHLSPPTPTPRSSPLSPRLEINRFVSQRPGDTEGRRQEQAGLGGSGGGHQEIRGGPPLSKCPEEGGWGWGGGRFNVHSQRTEII